MMPLPPVDPQAAARSVRATETAAPGALPSDNAAAVGVGHAVLSPLRAGTKPGEAVPTARVRPRVTASTLLAARGQPSALLETASTPALVAHLRNGVMAAVAAFATPGPDLPDGVWSVPSGWRLATAERAIESLLRKFDTA